MQLNTHSREDSLARAFPVAGAYNENELLDLIAHVEAAAGGKLATIVCTKKAARNLDLTPFGDAAKEDLYNLGYAGKFYGTPVVITPQRHKIGSTEFVLKDDVESPFLHLWGVKFLKRTGVLKN